jgi:hypothetical protein
MPSKSNPIVSSHRDAATRVSKFLSESHGIQLKPIVALEVVARALGANNWQTLLAMAEQGRAPRAGDNGIWCDTRDLPPVGPGSVVKDMLSKGLATMKGGSLHVVRRQPFGDSENILKIPTGPIEGQSMSAESVLDKVRNNLISRASQRTTFSPSDIETQMDRVMADMRVVLSPTQRAAVHQAIQSPVSLCSGYPDSGKAVIAEALLRTAKSLGLSNVINARQGDSLSVPVDGDTMPFQVPEYRPFNEGYAFHTYSAERLEALLDECEMLIIDERIAYDKNLLLKVLTAAPVTCRIVVLGQLPLADGSELSEMFTQLMRPGGISFIQLHEALRQQQLRMVGTPEEAVEGSPNQPAEVDLRGASYVPDYEIGEVKVGVNPRGYSLDTSRSSGSNPTEPSEMSAAHPFIPRANRDDKRFLPTVKPSEAWHINGFLFAPGAGDFASNNMTGKWCIVCDKTTVDDMWAKVCHEIRTYRLMTAMVSSPNNARAHGGSYIICVFTADWADEDDVMRTRDVLRELGVTQEIGYKRDIETFNGVYGTPAEWYYRA